ncbi:MAG: NUDIX hydrolase [Anaplasmataceae bacterium]|nr:NUDIX hydrolase [Anaplasmataceae bacterium]
MILTKEYIIAQYPDVEVNSDGDSDAYREELPIVERNNAAVIIKHPTENQYLIADWKQAEWKGFLTGGIEEGDSLEETVRKEIHEESGYKNILKITPMNFVARALFFHPVKNVNRLAHYRLVFAQLANLDKDNVSEEEANIADFIWVPSERVLSTVNRESMKMLWNFYTKQNNL